MPGRLSLAASLIVGVLVATGVSATADVQPQAIVQTVAVYGAACGNSELGTDCQGYFPDIERDPTSGDLLLVYRWSSAHTMKASEIRMVRSSDDGAHWSGATVLAQAAGTDYRDPSLTAIKSGAHAGRLLLTYYVASASTGAAQAARVRYKDPGMSSFSGGTIVTSSNLTGPYTTSKVVPLANGQILMPVYGSPTSGGPQRAAVIVSVDGGVTFDGAAAGRQKTVASSSTVYFQEPAIAELQPGHIEMMIRAQTKPGGVTTDVPGYQSDSYDNTYMTTWTAPGQRDVRMHGPEIGGLLAGTNLYPVLWSEPNSPTDKTYRPVKIKLRHTDVLWENTPTHTLYSPTSGWDAGYSSTIALSSTQLITAVYDTSRRGVFTLKYNTTDVD
jgi:hypothetical protein